MTRPPPPPATPRDETARLLESWLRAGPAHAGRPTAPGARPAVREVVHGVVRRWRTLAWVRGRLSDRPPREAVDACLLAALYALLYMDDEPAHAVVSEAVDLARDRGGAGAARFVNAVLRRAAREREALRRAVDEAPPAVRWSLPDVLFDRWNKARGPAAATALAKWSVGRPEIAIRLRAPAPDVRAFVDRARAAGLDAEPHPARPGECVALRGAGRIDQLPGYAEGAFVVQDPSTLAAVDLLAPQPGDLVLDACAAPGGKTAAIADRLAGRGRVLALDADAERLAVLDLNLRRLRLTEQVTTARADAGDEGALRAAAEGFAPDGFDRVLLDVPCTNTGVLRRRPEARWRFSAAALDALVARQRVILDAGAARLRPGGRLVYSTCSVEPEENGGLVRAWLAKHPEFMLAGQSVLVPPGSACDGAYAAALERRPA